MKEIEYGVFAKEVETRFYDCTPKGEARISTIMKNIGDVAGEDYTQRGMGHDILWEKGFVFLLSRVNIHFERLPKVGEDVEYATWERGIKGALFYRYYTMHIKGEKIGDASSAWLLVNPETRKIIKPSAFNGDYKIRADKIITAKDPERIRLPENAIMAGERIVYYSDLDENGHMNNANYANIAVDFLTPSMRERDIKGFSINYNHEALLGDTLEVMVAEGESGAIVGANFKGTQNNCFTAKIDYK